MKKIIIHLLFFSIFFSHFIDSKSGLNTYYIYLKPGEKWVNKKYNENTLIITYECSCYARKYNMRFRCADTSKNFTTRKLPANYYSMTTFAELASKEWESFKDGHFSNDKIYIIEQTSNHRYCYQLVQFYPIEHEE